MINLSKKELTPEEKALLQKGPKFAVTTATIPINEYISTTTVAALQAGEPSGVDCSGLYHDVNRFLNTFTNKPICTNITKSEHLALENLRKDKNRIIVTADKGVALVVMDKTEYITKCEALLQDNSVYQHLSRDTSPNRIHPTETSCLQFPSSKILWSSQDPQKHHAYASHSFSLWHSNIQHCQIHC